VAFGFGGGCRRLEGVLTAELVLWSGRCCACARLVCDFGARRRWEIYVSRVFFGDLRIGKMDAGQFCVGFVWMVLMLGKR
jgi:hypothetical protein